MQKRIDGQIQGYNQNRKAYQTIQLLKHNNQKRSMIAAITGPIDSPYEGYWFRIQINYPQNYPLQPPQFRLIDSIWHPSISFPGNQTCLDLLKYQWSPALTIFKALLMFMSILSWRKVQDYEGLLNLQAASQMINNYPYFFEQARKRSQQHSYKRQQIYNENQRQQFRQYEIREEGRQIQTIAQIYQKRQEMKRKRQAENQKWIQRTEERNV